MLQDTQEDLGTSSGVAMGSESDCRNEPRLQGQGEVAALLLACCSRGISKISRFLFAAFHMVQHIAGFD